MHGLFVFLRIDNNCSYERSVIFMKMNNKQIEELNELLVKHSETLTAFYDEGIEYGMNKGCVLGAIGSVVGMTIAYGVIKIVSHHKRNNEKES